jgi:hypothetical protein
MGYLGQIKNGVVVFDGQPPFPEGLRVHVEPAGEQSADTLSFQDWSAELHAWAANHRPIDHPIDDDRNSIYAGRGE